MMSAASLYIGTVSHRRLRPVRHHLNYRAFWLVLDLDQIDGVAKRLRWFARNRFNIFSFFDKDHGTGDGALRDYVEAAMRQANVAPDGGAIRLLCMPRIFGYQFNPLSVFFCHRKSGELVAVLYEVHNTFGERHGYLIPVTEPETSPLRQRADKRFYVSPFNDMQMTYDFRVVPPDERLAIAIAGSDSKGTMIAAALSARQTALTDAALLRLLFTHPLLTLKVIAAIHWHALKLWRKGLTLRTRPSAPTKSVSVAPSARETTV